MKTIRGKKALVTGAASGIGRAIALALAKEGAELFLVDIDEPRLQASARDAEALGTKVMVEVCDLSSPAQISSCVAACLAAFGELDILGNGAGVLLAPVQLVRELLPTLATRKESHILNVCSVVGLVPARKVMSYQTSKFGLVGFSLALRTGYSAYNIGVTALCPGLVDTPMLERLAPGWFKRSKLGLHLLFVTAETVARHAIASIRSNRAIAVVPSSFYFGWLVYRISLTFVLWLFRRRPRPRKRR